MGQYLLVPQGMTDTNGYDTYLWVCLPYLGLVVWVGMMTSWYGWACPYLGLVVVVVEQRAADEAHEHVLVVVLPPARRHPLQHLKLGQGQGHRTGSHRGRGQGAYPHHPWDVRRHFFPSYGGKATRKLQSPTGGGGVCFFHGACLACIGTYGTFTRDLQQQDSGSAAGLQRRPRRAELQRRPRNTGM